MSVPFRDAAELEAGGTAAFLRIVNGPTEAERRGALFQVNARGEPVEFTFNRVDLPASALWRRDDLERQAVKSLAVSLFEATRRTPLVLLCLASEIEPRLFAEDLEVQIPVCRLATAEDVMVPGAGEATEKRHSGEELTHLFWRPEVPGSESPQRRLVAALAARGLLLEPFERALAGLTEALDRGSEEA
ncbi:MAG TPA: hypothetical protein VKF14_13170 [Candidatus Dormibacteraeota bacterium]|nr:hypothetical protein [Candidatus Dormibacteraeota bacterium]